MTRYIYNTAGQYVAFIRNGTLYSPRGEWLGFVVQSNNVFDKSGHYLGFIFTDDRVLRRIDDPDKQYVAPAVQENTAPAPAPLKRLPMIAPPLGYRDVFESGQLPSNRQNRSHRSWWHALTS